MSRQKDRASRNRQKQWDLKRRELRSASHSTPSAESGQLAMGDIRSWPIVHSYVPIQDVFRATGFGSAGIVRLRPDRKWISAYFAIGLLDEGIKIMCGKDETDESENAEFLKLIDEGMPPLEPGPAELAASYIWGAHALGLSVGYEFDSKMSARYLGMVPLIGGSKSWWLQQFTGPCGLAAPGLVKYLKDHPQPEDIPEDKEVVVFTEAAFSCANTAAACAELRRQSPEFKDDGEEDGIAFFTWTRAYPKEHWSPLSRLRGRQILGSVEVHADHLVVESKVLSMAAILIGELKRAFGDDICLKNTQWKGTDDLIREAKGLDE